MKSSRLIIGLLTILVLFAVATAFKVAASVLIPLMIAWLLAYICGPVVNYLVGKNIPIGISIFAVLALVVFVCYLGGIFLISRVNLVLDESPRFLDQLSMIYKDATAGLHLPEDFLAEFNWVDKLGPKLASMSGAIALFMAGFTGNLLLVLIFLVFILLGKPYFTFKLEKAFPKERSTQLTEIMVSISKQIGQYLVIKVAISGITGVLVWLSLSLLHVEFALTWGALAFFLNFIPSIGSIIASVPPILLALVQYYPANSDASGSWMLIPILTAIILLTIQMVMGNVIEPKIMGDNLNLSPVVILLSLVFFGWLWGIIGALLSVPIAASIKIMCENVEGLKPVSILMGSGKVCKKELDALAE